MVLSVNVEARAVSAQMASRDHGIAASLADSSAILASTLVSAAIPASHAVSGTNIPEAPEADR